MARPSTIRTEQILEAARELFLEKGIDTPTAEIARHAGVSEGSIYKRFATKQALFFAAMGLQDRPQWTKKLAQLRGAGCVRENLQEIVEGGIAFYREHLPCIMMLWSSRELPNPAQLFREMGPEAGPQPFLEALTSYVESEVELGRLSTNAPEVVARALLGAIVNFALLETIGVEVRGTLDAATYARALVQTIWAGVAPLPESAAAAG